MTFSKSITTCFKKYITISGRASRSEYWWFALFAVVTNIGVIIIEMSINGIDFTRTNNLQIMVDYPVSTVVGTILFLPNWTSLIRRLHDTGRSGMWILLYFLPFIGFLILIFMLILRGTHGANIYGSDPLYAENAAPEIPPEERIVYEQEKSASLRELRNSRKSSIVKATYSPTIKRE